MVEWIRTTKRGYKYDKRLFWLALLLSVGYCIYVFYIFDFNFEQQLYLNCDPVGEYAMCNNPIPDMPNLAAKCNEEWCMQELLPRGEYGNKKPDQYFNNMMLITWLSFIGLFILNHFIHNKWNKLPEFEIVITKKHTYNIDDIKKIKFEEDEKDKDNIKD